MQSYGKYSNIVNFPQTNVDIVPVLIFKKINHLKAYLHQKKKQGQSVGFVPTMGALHSGHLSLIQASQAANTLTVCSIFVNPTQFNNPADLEKYPRLIEKDIVLLEKQGCNILFYPDVNEMYNQGEALPQIDLLGIDLRLEGEHRPGHFKGVATIVKKLFDAVEPHRAYFGQKDFQQVMVVKTLVQQLNMGIEIISVPTRRESNGLAMSSRNLRLTDAERQHAAIIYNTFLWAKQQLLTVPPKEVEAAAAQRINATNGATVEYFSLADAHTLAPVEVYNPAQKVVALTAVNMGAVRLIDNMLMN